MFTNISAVLFDIDGTLLDTSEFIIQAFEHTFSKNGMTPPNREVLRAIIGKPLVECYKTLAPERANDALTFQEMHREFQLNNLHLSKPFPNAVHTLTTLKDRGMRIAACTTRSKVSCFETLKNGGLFDFFEIILCLEDTTNLKPHPEPLIKALAFLHKKPSDAVMIGDSHVDIVAGKNTGTKTIRALYGVNLEHLHDPEPDASIHDIQEILDLLPTA